MTLFSRKALVAGATAVALTFSGTTVANAQSSFAGSSESTTAEGENTGNGNNAMPTSPLRIPSSTTSSTAPPMMRASWIQRNSPPGSTPSTPCCAPWTASCLCKHFAQGIPAGSLLRVSRIFGSVDWIMSSFGVRLLGGRL